MKRDTADRILKSVGCTNFQREKLLNTKDDDPSDDYIAELVEAYMINWRDLKAEKLFTYDPATGTIKVR